MALRYYSTTGAVDRVSPLSDSSGDWPAASRELAIAVAGGTGYLGTTIAKYAPPAVRWGRAWPSSLRADVLINCIRPSSYYAAIVTSLRLRRMGLPVLHISSTATYDRPLSRYGRYKLWQEWLLIDRALIVRLPHLYGGDPPGDSVMDRWLEPTSETIRVLDPERTIDFLPVDEVAQWLLRVARVLPMVGRLTLTSGERAPLRRWATRAALSTGKPVEIQDRPASVSTLPYIAIQMGISQELLSKLSSRQ